MFISSLTPLNYYQHLLIYSFQGPISLILEYFFQHSLIKNAPRKANCTTLEADINNVIRLIPIYSPNIYV